MQSRGLVVAGAFVATLGLGLVGGLVLFGGSDEDVPTSFTLAVETTTTTPSPPTTAGVATTVAETTTTVGGPAVITVTFEDTAPNLIPQIEACWAWIQSVAAQS